MEKNLKLKGKNQGIKEKLEPITSKLKLFN